MSIFLDTETMGGLARDSWCLRNSSNKEAENTTKFFILKSTKIVLRSFDFENGIQNLEVVYTDYPHQCVLLFGTSCSEVQFLFLRCLYDLTTI